MTTRTLLCPARLSALVIALALATVYAVGGPEAVAWFLGIGAFLLALFAALDAGARADADMERRSAAARTRGVWS